MPSPVEILGGLVAVEMVARLSSSDPLPRPINLAKIREASFPGYQPSIVTVYTQGQGVPGSVVLSGRAQFLNLGPPIDARPSALFLTAVETSNPLIICIPLSQVDLPTIPNGNFFLDFQAMAFLLPGSA